jgi:hypothetical protein
LQVGQTTLDGEAIPVAVVDVSPARFPAPSWWSNAAAFANRTSTISDETAASSSSSGRTLDVNETAPWKSKPQLFVYIGGQRMQLAAPPAGNGSMFMVDVSNARSAVRVGDAVCLLCEQQPAGDLGQVGVTVMSLTVSLWQSPCNNIV